MNIIRTINIHTPTIFLKRQRMISFLILTTIITKQLIYFTSQFDNQKQSNTDKRNAQVEGDV